MRDRQPISAEKIASNLARVQYRIAEAAQKSARNPASIKLVAVTKYSTLEETGALIQLGIKDLGESRVQDAEKKFAALNDPTLHWHLIGHLQTNKAAKAAALFNTIHSIDSDRVARVLDVEARKLGLTLSGLIEFNTAGESGKFGLAPTEAALFELLKTCAELPALRITGVMSMAPYSENPESSSREVFQRVRELFESANAAKIYPHPLTDLSMGMTQDFTIAIEEGATLVRVGSALFE